MLFNAHSNLKGAHALLSPSSSHWLRYDDEKLERVFLNQLEVRRGTKLHAFASEAIELGVKLPNSKKTLNAYVNDAIGFRMRPEQVLAYSVNAFGTADAISFTKRLLRIHDLKTGVTPASTDQVLVYASLFCLEYGYKPDEISMELRIYQNDEIIIYIPTPEEVGDVMRIIVRFDKLIEGFKSKTEE